MKKSSELTDFYYKTLYPALKELEKERTHLKHRVITVALIYTTFFVVLFFSLLQNFFTLDFLFLFLFAYFGIGAFIYKFLIKDYTSAFKTKIIEPLIKAIDENLNYSPELHLDAVHFSRSKLFNTTPDRVSGNDYVHGKIDGVNLAFSDFHAEKKHKDSKGRSSWSTIFRGLFIVSEFHKNFLGTTIVLPDKAQKAFGDLIGNWLQSNNPTREELIKMDDPAFEREFVVYGSDQIEARYILTHSLMQKLLNYKKRTKKDIYVSFVANNITLAIAYNRDLFEPTLFESLLNYKIAMEYIDTLHLATGIVKELRLNTKIWSKRSE